MSPPSVSAHFLSFGGTGLAGPVRVETNEGTSRRPLHVEVPGDQLDHDMTNDMGLDDIALPVLSLGSPTCPIYVLTFRIISTVL